VPLLSFQDQSGITMKVYSPEELAANNGKEGKPVLVAVDGKVYDLSASKLWAGGTHTRRHEAGADLSKWIRSAPHKLDVLERFQQVGVFQEKSEPQLAPPRTKIDLWLDRHPFFRRHPHPAIVHLPLGLICGVAIFEAAALITGSAKTEWAAFCCTALGVVFIPAAMLTGYITWWINYGAADLPVVRKKRRLAWTALAVGCVALLLRLFAVMEPLGAADPYFAVYLVTLAALVTVVSYVGYLGGTITFPYK